MRLAWIGLLGVLVCATLYAVSVPGWYFEATLAVSVGWMLVGAAWLVSVAARRRLEPADAVVPAVAVVVGALVFLDAPLHARYRLSRPAMDAAAKRVVAHPGRTRTIHRIGLWSTDRVEKIPGGMRFTVAGAGFLDSAGFAYSPRGEPARVGGEDAYRHLDGPWYLWDEGS